MPRVPPQLSSKQLVLAVLQVCREQAVTAHSIVRVCELLGVSENAARVALSRLTATSLVESDERGWYRLGQAADPVSDYLERWRLGESRRRKWNGRWLACALSEQSPKRTLRARSRWALELVGFRPGPGALWTRPDNLKQDAAEMLGRLGLEAAAECFVLSGISDGLRERLVSQYDLEGLQAAYGRAARELEESLERIPKLDTRAAMLESFAVGGDAIRVLARDPLLPEELSPAEPRSALTELTLRYDTFGRDLWNELVPEADLGRAPQPMDLLNVRRVAS